MQSSTDKSGRPLYQMAVLFAVSAGAVICLLFEVVKTETGVRIVESDNLASEVVNKKRGYDEPSLVVPALAALLGCWLAVGIIGLGRVFRWQARTSLYAIGISVGLAAGLASALWRETHELVSHGRTLDVQGRAGEVTIYEIYYRFHWRLVSDAVDPVFLGVSGAAIGFLMASACWLATCHTRS
ncbi:MAG: hypothetical protein AB7K24_11370 [Gemmataceae bacterium]